MSLKTPGTPGNRSLLNLRCSRGRLGYFVSSAANSFEKRKGRHHGGVQLQEDGGGAPGGRLNRHHSHPNAGELMLRFRSSFRDASLELALTLPFCLCVCVRWRARVSSTYLL